MIEFDYYMPTKVLFGRDALSKNKEILKREGSRAFIVTGKSSSRKNGSLGDLKSAMDEMGIEYGIFDDMQENPPLEMVEKAANMAKNMDAQFIVAVGGGSALDSAKGIAVLAKHENLKARDLVEGDRHDGLSVIAIPTTSGTGSEVTQYAIFTDHEEKTKKNFSHCIFPKYAIVDPKYTQSMPRSITVNTAVDALSHLVEGYMSSGANIISDALAEKGLELFGRSMDSLKSGEFSYEDRENFMLCSSIAGMVIAQAGTSLPHGMGYALTYFHGVEHGRANGALLKAYIEFCSDSVKKDTIVKRLGLSSVDELGQFLREVLETDCGASLVQLESYARDMMKNKKKLKNHPGCVEEQDILKIYRDSLDL